MKVADQEKGLWQALLDAWLVVRYTRHWVHYGWIAFVILCALIGAVRGLAGQ